LEINRANQALLPPAARVPIHPRLLPEERLHERLQLPGADRAAQAGGQALVEAQVVDRAVGQARDLAGLEEVAQVAALDPQAAGEAVAERVDRAVVVGEAGVLEAEPAARPGEHLAVARVP